jgi:hypothetical protein
MAIIVWGEINADGSILSGHGFESTRISTGQYSIVFTPTFPITPAIVGSQTRYGNATQDPRDNIVFPFVTNAQATALTGDNEGKLQDRNFSFIAVGP